MAVSSPTVAANELGKLAYVVDKVWRSSGGLVYEGNRLLHVMRHLTPIPNRLKHTVFNVAKNELVALLDEAWLMRGTLLPDDAAVYLIDMGRVIGTCGETLIRIVVHPGTSRIITAYPIQ